MHDLKPEDIESKKQIGTLDGSPVIEVVTTGGFHMVVVAKSGSIKTLGTGPHKVVARFIAEKRNPSIKLTELSKADWVPYETFQHLLPSYEALVDRLNALAP
jgi:hypothetical protein